MIIPIASSLKVILEDYNERTGEHFDFSKFKLKEDEDGRERVRDCEVHGN